MFFHTFDLAGYRAHIYN